MGDGFSRLDRLLAVGLVRKLAARFGLDERTIDVLRATTRLGEPAEVAGPTDLLPLLLRLAGTGLLSFQVSGPHRDWVWPVFLERQLDPGNPAYLPRGHTPMYLNATHRSWTGIGVFADPDEAVVDPAGMLTPRRWAWSIDVWVRDPDGVLHHPSRAHRTPGDAVTQRLVEGVPVVETTLTLATGARLVTTAFAADVAPGPSGSDSHAVLEARVEGPAADAHEVIVSVRPASPEGVTPLGAIRADGAVLHVDGEPAIGFDREPAAVGVSDRRGGDVAHALADGRDGPLPPERRCPKGLATGFARFGDRVRLAASMRSPGDEKALAATARERDVATAIARWRRELAPTPTLLGADPETTGLWDAARATLLLLYDHDEAAPADRRDQITPGPLTYHHFWFRDAAFLTVALTRLGRGDLAGAVLATFSARQARDGFFKSQDGEWDSNGLAIWAIVEHFRVTRDRRLLERLWPAMLLGARWIGRKRRAGARDAAGHASGLLPPGMSAEHLGPNDYYYWDDLWGLRGLRDAAFAAGVLGRRAEATELCAEAESFAGAIEASLERVAERLGAAIIPAGPLTGLDSGAIGSVAAGYPAETHSPDDPRLLATIDLLRERSFHEGAFFQHVIHGGTNIYLSLQIAQVELRAGRAGHRAIWRRVLALASPTGCFPEAIHPQTGGGCMGDGHHGWAAAEVIRYLEACFAVDDADGLDLVRGLDPAWIASDGATASLGPIPTRYGPVTVAAHRDGDDLVIRLDRDGRGGHPPPARVRAFAPTDPARFVELAADAGGVEARVPLGETGRLENG